MQAGAKPLVNVYLDVNIKWITLKLCEKKY